MKNLIDIPEMEFERIPEHSMVLAEGAYYDTDCYKTGLNNNVLVVGATGAGKTRGIVTPNLLQASGSYIVSDPKGNLYKQYGHYLRRCGYVVKLLNFTDPANSIGYNFFRYIRSQTDILKIAHMLLANRTTGDGGKPKGNSGFDPFWDNMAEILLVSLMDYLWEYRPANEQTIDSLLKLIEAAHLSEYDPSDKSPLDRIMDQIGKRDKNSLAYRNYQQFAVGAIRTKQSVLITLASHLGKYNVGDVKKMLAKDETKIEEIGKVKTAFFVQVSDNDRSLDDLANMFFTQAMNELCRVADTQYKDYRLPIDVRFILDDFATNCSIAEFPRMISSIRSRGISTMLMIQAESQLKARYGDEGETIIGNCDTYVYLGTNDINTSELVAKRCNMSLEKVMYMPLKTAIIFRRGSEPVMCKSFRLENHIEHWLSSRNTNKYYSRSIA